MKNNKPRVAVIGPVAPYRGGIAQYTTEICKVLAGEVDLSIYSFDKQYPGWLYPGESDVEKGTKRRKDVNYTLRALSPISWRNTAKQIAENHDAVIINWWTLFWQPAFAYMARVLKKKGVKVIFLCHNIGDHGDTGLKAKLSDFLLKQADAYIVHTAQEKNHVGAVKENAETLLRPHPIYTHFPKAKKKLPRDADLELLFFGFIRPYKGLGTLIDALTQTKNNVHLRIVGEVWKNKDELMEKIKNSGANIDYTFSYVNDTAAANYFEACDVVILPYLSATGSGVATLAYNYNKPIIASNVGGLTDTVSDKTGWLVAPGNATELAKMIDSITRSEANSKKNAIQDYCKENSWKRMAEEVRSFIQTV